MTVESTTTAGLDIGASNLRVAIVRSAAGREHEVLALRRRIRPPGAVAESVRAELLAACLDARVAVDDLSYVASTGDDDVDVGAHGHFYSPTTHSWGAVSLLPEARAVLDIGALHMRLLTFDGRGKLERQHTTTRCSAGSGRVLEHAARRLGVDLGEVGELHRRAARAEPLASTCSVLAEADIDDMVSRCVPAAQVLRGVMESIVRRALGLVRTAQLDGVVMLSGGASADPSLCGLLAGPAGPTSLRWVSHPQAGEAGAIGAALIGGYRAARLGLDGAWQAANSGKVP